MLALSTSPEPEPLPPRPPKPLPGAKGEVQLTLKSEKPQERCIARVALNGNESPGDRSEFGPEAFQDGYTARDLERLNEFMQLFDPTGALEVTGTGGVQPGDDEWCLGLEAVRRLVENDWQYWGNLRLDLAGARIHAHGEVAWLSTSGTISMIIEKEPGYQNFLNYVRWLLDEQPGLGAETVVMDILRGGSNTLFELQKGSSFSWPLRFAAVLVRRAEGWRFQQVTFSYPTTRFPDVRNEP